MGTSSVKGWKKTFLDETTVYVSMHLKNESGVPKWAIYKVDGNWDVRFASPMGYSRITGMRPFSRLRDAKYYVDVEVKRFYESERSKYGFGKF